MTFEPRQRGPGAVLRSSEVPSTLARLAGLWRVVLLALLVQVGLAAGVAQALEVVPISREQAKIDLTSKVERYAGRGDKLQVETAPGPDGVAGRVEVKAQNTGTNPSWIVFALRNTTDRPIDRWVVAERFTFVGSGILFPDLDAARIAAITPSQGFVPERVLSDRADIFQLTIEPGQTVTFVAEMASERFPAVTLWKPFLYEAKQRERTLLNGILLGITGLLAVFLTALFAANHKVVFPTTGLVAWSVLAFLCVDFGFWHRVFKLSAEDNALYRAASEAAVAASLVIFLYSFLKLARWHSWIRMLWLVWIAGQLVLVAVAPLDPVLASTLARASFLGIATFGSLFILYLILANQDRAFALLPSWLLLMVWIFAAALAAIGKLNGEFIAAGLISGLVLIVLLIGFTVTQFAFRSGDATLSPSGDSSATRNYAIEGAGAATWEWSAKRGEIVTGGMMEEVLGLQRGQLSCGLDDWLAHLRGGDRERLRSQIEGVAQKGAGQLQSDFQMRGGDGSYRWFSLRAAALPISDQKGLRCVGLLREITREKRAHERMVLDAVRDNLTGLPNRELFLDRLGVGFSRSRQDASAGKVALLLIEIDGLDKLQEEFGSIRTDSMLLTIAKRLVRNVGPQDSLARIDNVLFAILIGDGGDPREVAMFAERARRSVRSPMKFSGREVILTASTGIAGLHDDQAEPADLLRDADMALFKAKRGGIDRVEVFQPSMRSERDDRGGDVALLRKAMERKQIFALYQPIYSISPERLAGFECVLRWEHPDLGAMGPAEFMRIAERGGIASQLALQILEQAAKDAAGWHRAVPRTDNPLFVNVNLGDRLPLQPEFVQEIRALLGRHNLAKGTLRLEVSDAAIRQNPERGVEVLDWLRSAGAGAILADFGAGQVPLGDLSRLAIDGIRLDRWLCFDALGDGPGAPLVRGIAALARELGRPVMADSVENPEDIAALRAAGCTLALGPLYGDPLSERQLDELLTVVRKAEQKNERRGLFGGGMLAGAKAKEASTSASKTNGATKTSRKKAPRDVAQHAGAGVPYAAESNGHANGAGELIDYDEAIAAAMLASANDAARLYEQVPPSRQQSVLAPIQLPVEPVRSAPPPPVLQTASITGAISEAVSGHLQGQAAQRLSQPSRLAAEPETMTSRKAGFISPSPATFQPAQLVINSNPTVLPLAPASMPASDVPPTQRSAFPPPPAYPPAPGLARLQRGTFGVRPVGSVGTGAPTAAAMAAAAALASPAKTTSAPLDAQGQPPVGLADTLPDGDVLRGLAQRLEAALRREGR